MIDTNSVAAWHDRILSEALAWRENHPDFRFNIRAREVNGENRLSRGYWFTGNDRYLFFAPFRPNDYNNKTRTIGFVINFDEHARPTRSYIEVVYGSWAEQQMRSVHDEIVHLLASFKKVSKSDKYQREYSVDDPVVAFREFLTKDYPRILDIIKNAGEEARFTISDSDFKEALQRVETARRTNGKPMTQTSQQLIGATNLILYGPPGTGKTWTLQNKLQLYTDQPASVDRSTWLHEAVATYGWRAVIASAMAQLGRPLRVPEVRNHEYVQAK